MDESLPLGQTRQPLGFLKQIVIQGYGCTHIVVVSPVMSVFVS
ncbi:hypothetical protein THIOKS12540009 [Thiocapsa sp. KS1]|nr:hypothetical protein THIOKS12540009 [Thiocapsa sp. KS1]